MRVDDGDNMPGGDILLVTGSYCRTRTELVTVSQFNVIRESFRFHNNLRPCIYKMLNVFKYFSQFSLPPPLDLGTPLLLGNLYFGG